MTTFAPPVVAWHSQQNAKRPLVVLLHGRGSDETDIMALVRHLPADLVYAAPRAPIAEGGGYAWFANRGIGRPVAASLHDTMTWFRTWLDEVSTIEQPVVLVGFSGGAAFAGGLVLAEPSRYAGVAILYGTLPFDAGVSIASRQLVGLPVLVIHGEADVVIPSDLLKRTWIYLHNDSGATITGIRDPGGHGLSPASLGELSHWLKGLTSGNEATP